MVWPHDTNTPPMPTDPTEPAVNRYPTGTALYIIYLQRFFTFGKLTDVPQPV